MCMFNDENKIEMMICRRNNVKFDEMLTELEEETDDEEIRRYLHTTSYDYVSDDTERDEEIDEESLGWD